MPYHWIIDNRYIGFSNDKIHSARTVKLPAKDQELDIILIDNSGLQDKVNIQLKINE